MANAQEYLYGVANIVIKRYIERLLKCRCSRGIGVPEQKRDIVKTRKMSRLQVFDPPRLAPYPPPSPPPSLPPLRNMMLGDGARKRAHNLNRIGQGGGSISSGVGKKVKNHGIVHRVTHDFYVKINPREKSGDAVACASVAPVRLHHLICHKGINT